MKDQRKDRFFQIAGIAGLAGLLMFTLWMRSVDRSRAGSRNRDKASEHVSGTHDHQDPSHHEMNVSSEELSGQAGIRLPSGNLANGIREVSYEAFQYGFDPDPLIVRAGEKVRLLVKSRDVEHGMMIPEVDFNAPMPLDKAKAVEFTAPVKAGEYPIFCSIFCGTGHGAMKGTLTVLPANNPDGSAPASAHPDPGDGHGHR